MLAEDTYLGHVPGLTNEQYHAAPGYSKSKLDAIAGKSALHYWATYEDPNREVVRTKALDIGQAAHLAILEPDILLQKIAQMPDCDRRTKEGKKIAAEFELEHAGKIHLRYEDFESVLGLRDAFHKHPVASGLVTRGKPEQSYFGIDDETGEVLKCRTDWIYDDLSIIIDLKSTEDASPWAFGRSAATYRYDLQAAWYPDVVKLATGNRPQHFVWIAFEKSPPYAIGIYYATPEQIDRARIAARKDFMRILHHKKTNSWPDYGSDIVQLQLPGWTQR